MSASPTTRIPMHGRSFEPPRQPGPACLEILVRGDEPADRPGVRVVPGPAALGPAGRNDAAPAVPDAALSGRRAGAAAVRRGPGLPVGLRPGPEASGEAAPVARACRPAARALEPRRAVRGRGRAPLRPALGGGVRPVDPPDLPRDRRPGA